MRPDIEYDVPSTAETIGMFFIDIFLYAVLAWYFDHVDESNRGKSYDKLFFLRPSYWFDLKTSKKQANLPSDATPQSDDSAVESIQDPNKNKRNSSVNTYMNINGNTPEKLLNEQIEGLNKSGN